MSEIQRYMYARDGMVPDAEHLRGSGEPEFWVRFTDHEAERAENLATIDFLNKELRSAVDALADAKARIEGERIESGGMDSWESGYHTGIDAALAALTQPQTERCPEDCDGFGRLIGDSDGPCPACSGLESDGGGAATAAGVADADLVRVGDFFGIPAFTHPDVKPGIVGIVSAGEVTATITGTAPQRPGDAIKKEES
jgi:hypothetical protein